MYFDMSMSMYRYIYMYMANVCFFRSGNSKVEASRQIGHEHFERSHQEPLGATKSPKAEKLSFNVEFLMKINIPLRVGTLSLNFTARSPEMRRNGASHKSNEKQKQVWKKRFVWVGRVSRSE